MAVSSCEYVGLIICIIDVRIESNKQQQFIWNPKNVQNSLVVGSQTIQTTEIEVYKKWNFVWNENRNPFCFKHFKDYEKNFPYYAQYAGSFFFVFLPKQLLISMIDT